VAMRLTGNLENGGERLGIDCVFYRIHHDTDRWILEIHCMYLAEPAQLYRRPGTRDLELS
jgi:hypothetical protein